MKRENLANIIKRVRATEGRTIKSTIASIEKAEEILARRGRTITHADEVKLALRKKL